MYLSMWSEKKRQENYLIKIYGKEKEEWYGPSMKFEKNMWKLIPRDQQQSK